MRKIILSYILLGMTCMAEAQSLPVYLDPAKNVEERTEDVLRRMMLVEKVKVIHVQSKFSSTGVPRLGFPNFWTDDGPHGVRPGVLWDERERAGQTNDLCVAFPTLTCLTASWNPQLGILYGQSLGEEARYRGKNIVLGPGVNINRTPLNGRNFKYMDEDPFLASRVVVPYVQGLQSIDVATCVKHYALNNDEGYRHQVNVVVDDGALHEIYLPTFEAAVQEGKAWGIMGAYNLYKNQYNCHNQYLLNDILKHDWRFDGVVVSDWGGVHDTEQAIKNRLDMEFGTWTDGFTMGATNVYDSYYLARPYLKLIQEGKFTTRELDEKVCRVLRLLYCITMDQTYKQGFLCSDAHYEVAQKVAGEGTVLLKNQGNMLPIDLHQAKRVLMVGEDAIKMMTVGGGSSSLKVQCEISPLSGLKIRLVGKATVDYARDYVGDVTGNYNGVIMGQDLPEKRSTDELIAEAISKAKAADYVIFFDDLNKSNYRDCEGHDRKSYGLPYQQDRVITALAKADKNFVYVNISGNTVEIPWMKQAPAIVQGWFIDSQAGVALASVLVDDANPSDELSYVWLKALNDAPAHRPNSYPETQRADREVIDETYKEGIFVGHRWVDKDRTKPLFTLGHGLSYTSFDPSSLRLSQKKITENSQLTATVTVKNTGHRAGAEVVQLHVSDLKSSLLRLKKELKGFKKVYLAPREAKDVNITIDRSALSFYHDKLQKWVAEPSDFEVLVSNASDHLSLKAKFTL